MPSRTFLHEFLSNNYNISTEWSISTKDFVLNSEIIHPLDKSSEEQNITLEGDVMHAFNTAKTTLANFTELSFIDNDPQTKILLTTDASDKGGDTVIEQELKSQHKQTVTFSDTFISLN